MRKMTGIVIMFLNITFLAFLNNENFYEQYFENLDQN